jgi:hypothetical protein
MNVKITPGEHEPERIEVTLSRRNLLSLLAKLDGHPPNSACTIDRNIRETDLVVVAQEDEDHYADRQVARGIMHPDTEEAIA